MENNLQPCPGMEESMPKLNFDQIANNLQNLYVLAMNSLSLEEFALKDNKPNVISWGHMKFRDVTLFDFGLHVEDNDNMIAVQAKIKEIDKTFDLVMVMEHFDESMVLLKHLLCWEYSNLTSLKLNVRDEKTKSHVSDEARKKLAEWLHSDMVFYDHFKKLFKPKVKAFGEEKMSQELSKIKSIDLIRMYSSVKYKRRG